MITVTLEEHEARALVFSSDMGDMLMERSGIRSPMPRYLSPRALAIQKIESALARQETPSGFEALGVEANHFERRTWEPGAC